MRSTSKKFLAAGVALLTTVGLAGCSLGDVGRGYMPGPEGVTNHTDRIVGLWTTSWILLLVIGVIVWGLIIAAVIVYRRRKSDTGYPVQLRYNMPIEIAFTVLPVILILGFFSATARDMSAIQARADDSADVVKISAIGKQWSWDFSYLDHDVHEPIGVQANYTGGDEFDESVLPTLYLPVNREVEIKLDSYDVAHSFWVTNFLYKKDMLPGKDDNYMTFIPQVEGTFQGKCAELCGEYHSMMLFNVKVVSQQEFDDRMAYLEEQGNTGILDLDLKRNQNLPGISPIDAEEH